MYNILELNKKLLPELRRIAKSFDVEETDAMKKRELVIAIMEAQGGSSVGSHSTESNSDSVTSTTTQSLLPDEAPKKREESLRQLKTKMKVSKSKLITLYPKPQFQKKRICHVRPVIWLTVA